MPEEQKAFSWGFWILGLFLAIVIGAIGNVIAGAMSMGFHEKFAGFVLGLAPGLVMGIPAVAFMKRSAFAGGVCVGACVIALIGGACGASMVGTSFR